MDLATGKTSPYRKPLDKPLYVNKLSSHPPAVIKTIPGCIQDRLSKLSSTAQEFDLAKPAYCTALSKAGYQNQLQFQPPRGEGGKRNRARKITWFTPPFNIAARCDMNRLFQRIIANAFPPGHEYLNKLFNTRNLKLSYSTTPNLGSIINSHNSYIMKNYKTAGTVKRMCNCQVKASCPMKGKCLAESLVYRADVTTSGPINEKKFYIGACSLDFKSRFRNHQKSLRHERYKTETALSLYVWEMRDKGADVAIEWSIAKTAPPYKPGGNGCRLCLAEKATILKHSKDKNCLNKRGEVFSKCRHRAKFLLAGVKT